MSEQKDQYFGIVKAIDKKLVYCDILVGQIEIRLPFGIEIFRYKTRNR